MKSTLIGKAKHGLSKLVERPGAQKIIVDQAELLVGATASEIGRVNWRVVGKKNGQRIFRAVAV